MPAALALAPEVVAILALLVVMSALVLTELLQKIMKGIHIDAIPIIGNALIGAVGFVGNAIGDAASWLWQHANPINMFLALAHWLLNFFASVVGQVAWDVTSTLQRIVSGTIPAAINGVQQWAYHLFVGVYAAVATAVSTAEGYAAGLYNRAIAVIGADVAAVESYAAGLFNRAVAIAAADVAGAEAWVGNELAGLRTWIDARVGQAIDYVDQRVGQAETWAAGEIGALRGYITGTLAPAIAAAAAVAATAAADLARWKKDCGDPLCNNLSTFGNEIAAIEAGLGDVAIIALLAAAVSDPQGVANEVVSLIDGPVNAVWSEVSGLLGIKAA